MWIARDKDGTLLLFKIKPVKDLEFEIWTADENSSYPDCLLVDDCLFRNVQWDDIEPTEVRIDIIKNNVKSKAVITKQ